MVLAAPALFFAASGARRKAELVAATLLIGSLGYLPAATLAPGLVFERVIAYPGLVLTTAGGMKLYFHPGGGPGHYRD